MLGLGGTLDPVSRRSNGIGKDGCVPPDRSELASIAEMLAQLTARITAIAEGVAAEKDESSATELFAIERTLHGANRRLTRLLTQRR
jgi:hypothetical protein